MRRRSPLKRKTEMRQGTSELKRTEMKTGDGQLKRTRMKPMSDKRKGELPMRRKVSEAVLKRDGHQCRAAPFFPDSPCGGGLHVHHLLKSIQGGIFEEENLIACCDVHNDRIEDSPEYATRMGLVRRPHG